MPALSVAHIVIIGICLHCFPSYIFGENFGDNVGDLVEVVGKECSLSFEHMLMQDIASALLLIRSPRFVSNRSAWQRPVSGLSNLQGFAVLVMVACAASFISRLMSLLVLCQRADWVLVAYLGDSRAYGVEGSKVDSFWLGVSVPLPRMISAILPVSIKGFRA